MELADLIDRHAGRPAFLIGTGPGLDRFDWDRVEADGGFVIACHRAFGVTPRTPGRTYWQVLDDAWSQGIPGEWVLWRDQVTSGAGGVIGLFRDPLYMPRPPHTPNGSGRLPPR